MNFSLNRKNNESTTICLQRNESQENLRKIHTKIRICMRINWNRLKKEEHLLNVMKFWCRIHEDAKIFSEILIDLR